MKATMSLSVDRELLSAVRKYADANGMKISSLICVLLRKYLKEQGIEVE